MTVMNIVHMRVKPGREAEFIALHKELNASVMVGMRNFWVTKVGERSYCVVGEWSDMEALVIMLSHTTSHTHEWRDGEDDLPSSCQL